MKRFLLGLIFTLLASPAFAQLPVCNNGDMIYRGSVGYQCVPFDNTAGKFLQGQGGAAAPIWSNQASQAFKLPTQSTNTFLGNTTGGTASPTPNSVSQILDTIGYDIARPPQPGALIYKSQVAPNNAWQSLAPTPNIGWVLVSGGLSNPPSWAFSQSSATPGVAGTCLISTGTTTSPTYQACLNALNFAVSSPIAVSFATPITTVSCPTCVTSSGGGAITGTAPVIVSAAGAVSCPTCATSSGGGAITGTSPISVSAAGVVSLATPVSLTFGGTNAALTASNGGLIYSTATAFAILNGTATANQIPLSGSSTTPSWSTATYPATTAAGTVLGSASANVIAATATPTLGANGGTGGQITLNGSTSGSGALRVAAAAGTATIFQLPATNGSSGNVLSTDGTGVLAWSAAGATTITESQGHPTLQSGVPIMLTSQSAKTSLFYDCSIGKNVPYYTGSVLALDAIPSCEVTDALVSAASAGQIVANNVYDMYWEGNTHHNFCLPMSGASGGGGGWSSDTAGSNTARGSGYSANPVRTATIPFLTNPNTLTNCFNGSTNYGPITANLATYIGTVYASANGQISFIYGAAGSGGVAALLGVWSPYNQALICTTVTDNGANYTYTSATPREARGSTTNIIQFVTGLAVDAIPAFESGSAQSAAAASASGQMGLGLDSTTAILPPPGLTNSIGTTAVYAGFSAPVNVPAQVGFHTLSKNEVSDGTHANTFDATANDVISACILM